MNDLICDHPFFSKISEEDFTYLVVFFQEIKEKFDTCGWSLTISLPATNNFYNNYKNHDFRRLAKAVDFINFIQNRFYVIKSLEENLRDANFVEINVKKFMALGVPASKTVIGVSFKGATFDANFIQNLIGYNEICRHLLNNEASEWERSYLSSSELAILKNHHGNHTIVFESSRSIANKMRFAMKRGLAGIITASIIRDDYEGGCVEDEDTFVDFQPEGITLNIPQRVGDRSFPLIRTINEAINVTLDEMRQAAIRYQKPSEPTKRPIAAPPNSTTQVIGNNGTSHLPFNKCCAVFLVLVTVNIQINKFISILI